MAKIHKLQNDADYYFSKGVTYSDNGEYTKAIDCFFRAYEKDKESEKTETLLEIGACYAMLGEHDAALRTYYKALAIDNKNESAFVGIISSLIEQNKNPEAIYYINYSDAKNIIGEDYDVSVTNRKTFKVIGKYDREATVFVARKLMANGEYSYARKLLEEIPPESKDYTEALNLIAMINLGEEKHTVAVLVCDSVLARDPDNVNALTTKIVASHYAGYVAQRDDTIEYLDSLNLTKEQDIKKISACMQQVGNEELALKYYKKLLEFTPTDKNTNLILAILYHNAGLNASAHSVMVKLSKLYPDCESVKYYAYNLREGNDNFELSCQLPHSEQDRRFDEVNDKLSSLKTTEKTVMYTKKHKEFYDLLRWIITFPQVKIAGHVASFLAQSTYFHPLIREMLVNPDVNYYPKRECLSSFLEYAQKKSFALFSQDVVQFYRPHLPKIDVPREVKAAYWTVYASCVFLTYDFDKMLNQKYKEFVKCIMTDEETEKIFLATGKETLSALFAYVSKIHPVFNDVKSLSRVFDADEKKLKLLIAKYEKTEENL